jgi:carboxyl-terminal processing protease
MNRMTEDAKGSVDSAIKGKPYKTPKGHVVYGGGGIYPDKWIPGAVIHVDSNYRLLWEDNFINDFSFTWYLQHQSELNKYKDVPSYLKGMSSLDIWTSLLQAASPQQKQVLLKLTANKGEIKNQVLAMIARSKWYKVGYYQALNILDPQFADMMP